MYGGIGLDLVKVSLLFAFFSTLAFVGIYTWIAPWWEEQIGRTIVYKDIALLLAFLVVILGVFFHVSIFLDPHVADYVVSGIYTLIGSIMVWRSIVWIKIHRRKL